MSKANRKKRYHQREQAGLRDDPVMQELFDPLLQAIGPEHAAEFWQTIKKEPEGVLAWGVRSGYLLWVRTNPGVTPMKEQITQWMQK
jgi:hypothetical protein